MKQLHRMIIKAFLGPLSITFVIVLFILVMQFLWKYVDDLMGKGLEWYVLVELLTYATASFVPLALPLAVLLASIMTLGGLGENSELVPMRSAGLGLSRILAPLFVLVLLISGFSFYFSNNLLPIANLKFQSLLWDVTRKKPALNLRPGIFYDGIDGFRIRVMDKDEDTGVLHDVLIYDHRAAFQGNRTVLRARTGTMRRSTDGLYLLLTLNDGHFYDEHGVAGRTGSRGNNRYAMMRGTFEREEFRLDLTGLGLDRTDQDLFKDHYKMLTVGQLLHAEDSLHQRMRERNAEQVQHLRNSLYVLRDMGSLAGRSAVPMAPVQPAPAGAMPGADRPEPSPAGRDGGTATDSTGRKADPSPTLLAGRYELAMNIVRNQINFLDRTIEERNGRQEQIARFEVEMHRKPMLAFACLVFFLIGAPLGAIIRRGGMGLPTVFAIVFFLVFHIVSFSTEKLVIAGGIGAWPGMWISTLLLLPIGLFLTWKASTDSPLLDSDAYYRGWDRLRSLFRRPHADPPTV